MKKSSRWSRWSHGSVTVSHKDGVYHVSIGGLDVLRLEEAAAFDLLEALRDGLASQSPVKKPQWCDYCGINPPIGVDDGGRAYCGDCVIYAVKGTL